MGVRDKVEYGDFQTPHDLAEQVVRFLADVGVAPLAIVEPTCGRGSFVHAAATGFPSARKVFALDISSDYVEALQSELHDTPATTYHVYQQDFFSYNWEDFFARLAQDILVLGNPPWVTSAALGVLGSNNLPPKTNFQGHRGFAAKTGKANFDISEWMLIKLLQALGTRKSCVAMLCKTATARKVLRHAWRNRFAIGNVSLHMIDAKKHFGVSVDACLLFVQVGVPTSSPSARVYSDLSFDHLVTTYGFVSNELLANADDYVGVRDLDGFAYYVWRSGIKHDAASVMELRCDDSGFVNGLGERVEIEPTFLFPLLKSSDLANARLKPDHYVLLTQQRPAEGTDAIKERAPRTWDYLMRHADALDHRRSSIYQRRPRFSVFGIGDYTFSPWKVAVSGLYKNCQFQVLGRFRNKPIVVDDTCYSIPCSSEQEARYVSHLLNSELARRFLYSLIFIDAKRPITIDVLNRLDLKRVAERMGLEGEAHKYFPEATHYEDGQALLVFEHPDRYVARKPGGRPRRRCG